MGGIGTPGMTHSGVAITPVPVRWQWAGIEATVEADEVRLVHVRDRAELRVCRGRLIPGLAYTRAPAETRRALARVGAILRLRERGRYLMHGAGVVDPMGRGWLLAGDSGAGKSTLAYALVRLGWTLLGDDGVLLEAGDTGPVARAWREPLRVSAALSRVFPELASELDRGDAADPRRRIPVEFRVTPHAPVAGVLFVARAARDEVTRLTPEAALVGLVRQSPWVLLGDAASAGHLTTLRHFATSVPAFRLEHTAARLANLPQTLFAALD